MEQMGWLERSVCLGLGGGLRQFWGMGGKGTELEEDEDLVVRVSQPKGANSRCSFKEKPGRTGKPTAGTAGWVLKLAETGRDKVGIEGLAATHGAL